MYVLGDLADRVILDCCEESLNYEGTCDALLRKLQLKYVDRVIVDEGLCVTVHELGKVEALPILGPNDGRSCYRVVCKAMLFKPLPNELLFAVIRQADQFGLKLSTGFFQDIRVPAHMLPSSAVFDGGQWQWSVEESGGNLVFELGALCRLRVVDVVYNKQTTVTPGTTEQEDTVPMLVVGAMNDSGLGVDAWWAC